MKKVLLFPFLVLGLVGFIVSCQKEPVSAPVQHVQQEEALAIEAFSLFTYKQIGTEPSFVEDRDDACCAVSYNGFVPTGSQVSFLIKKPKYHRVSTTITKVGGQSFTFTGNLNWLPNCTDHGIYCPIAGLACLYFPGISGNFQITYKIQVPGDISGTWVDCASATSPSFFVSGCPVDQ